MLSSASFSVELSSSTPTEFFCPGREAKMRGGKIAAKWRWGKKKHTTNHQSVMSIWFESSLDILKETLEQISNKRKTRYVSACCNTFTEFLANIFGLNKVLIKYMKKLNHCWLILGCGILLSAIPKHPCTGSSNFITA